MVTVSLIGAACGSRPSPSASSPSGSITPTPTPSSISSPTPAPTSSPSVNYQNIYPDAQVYVSGCVDTGQSAPIPISNDTGVVVEITGTLTNTDPTTEVYIVSVGADHGFSLGTGSVQLNNVAPGATVGWSAQAVATNPYPGEQFACSVLDLMAQAA